MTEPAKVIPIRPHVLERKGGIPNPVWDAVELALGYPPRTDSEKKLWNRMCASLTRAKATPEQIEQVAAWYRRHWPDIDLTITAIEKWYSHFLAMAEKRELAASGAKVCPDCGMGNGVHNADCERRTS